MRSRKRIGISEVLVSVKSTLFRKPSDTSPKWMPSLAESSKWNDGATTRPLRTSGSGSGCPCSFHTKVSLSSPSRSERKRTSTICCWRERRWPAVGEKEKREAKRESLGVRL